jgi:hypothetical protein
MKLDPNKKTLFENLIKTVKSSNTWCGKIPMYTPCDYLLKEVPVRCKNRSSYEASLTRKQKKSTKKKRTKELRPGHDEV